jgi:ABC-2 type transport system permease protein
MSAPTSPVVDVPASSVRKRSRTRALWPLFVLLLRNQVTKGRIAALGGLGILGIAIAPLVTGNTDIDATIAGTRFVNLYCLSLLTPVVSLVFGSGSLGDLVDDRTLVYLWLPPVPRWSIALAAWMATLVACFPFAVVTSAITALATGGGADLLIGTIWSSLLALVAYSGLFTALGLRYRRALVWGFAYLLIWENFIAQAGNGTARLSILSYARSVLSAYTGAGMKLADRDLTLSFIVPVVVGIAAVAYTARRLHRQDID